MLHAITVVDDHLIRINRLDGSDAYSEPDFTADQTTITVDTTTRTADET